MVARMVRDHEAMGSNPVTPTKADAKTKTDFAIGFFHVVRDFRDEVAAGRAREPKLMTSRLINKLKSFIINQTPPPPPTPRPTPKPAFAMGFFPVVRDSRAVGAAGRPLNKNFLLFMFQKTNKGIII